MKLLVFGLILTTMLGLGLIAWRLAAPPVQVVQQAQSPAPAPTERYLVAAHVLPAGTLARPADITDREAPPGHVPPGAILDTPFARASIEGALIRNYTDAGAPITETNVLRPRDRGFLAAVLPKGSLAVSILVDQVSGVAGLIWPGDHVNVMLTQNAIDNPAVGARVQAGRQVMTETLLYDTRVIAVDQEIVQGAPPTAGVAGRLAHTVTLEVTQRDAERLNVAQNLGRLSLAIRAADQAPGPQFEGPIYAGDVAPSLMIPVAQVAPLGASMQVIEGDKRTEIRFPAAVAPKPQPTEPKPPVPVR